MPLYLTVSRGPRADMATPVLASSDPLVVNAVLEAIGRLSDAEDADRGPASRGQGIVTRFPNASGEVEP
ncbi:MAG: hypothetical protein M3Q10_14235 [Chloroflexota bacterium]|nr:hypothetical protein [Chloroflexota bacterium]